MLKNIIEVKGLKKNYIMGDSDLSVLKSIDLEVRPGEFIAIMGPSGSGKSTLAQILGLLDRPSSGSYKLFGKNVENLLDDELAQLRCQEIGFIFQQFNLLPRVNVLENVKLPLLYSQADEHDYAVELISKVGLAHRIGHFPNQLSGGQQQRVAIARALMNRPKILFADEPTGNLDSQSEAEILNILKDLHDQGLTIIMVTHEEEIANMAQRVIKMRDGVIISDVKNNSKPNKQAQKQMESKVNHLPTGASQIFFELIAYLNQAFKILSANKVRSGLSVLGILIGVAAVVAMLGIGNGASKALEEQLSSLGSNLLVLRSGSRRLGGVAQTEGITSKLYKEDAVYLQEKIDKIKTASPNLDGKAQVSYGNKNWSTQILGILPSYAELRNIAPTIGRFFTLEEDQKRARVCLVGLTVLKELFVDKNPIGEDIKINKVNFKVIGVLPEKGGGGWRDQDDLIIIPLQTAMKRVLGRDYVDNIDIQISDSSLIKSAEEEIIQAILERKKVPLSQSQNAFVIRNMADIQQAISESSRTMSSLLAFIAAISLLVGGIGIMNIMLVSVIERTKEVGLRKAIGAKRRDILIQFLTESIVISLMGAMMGVLLGISMTFVLTWVAGWTTLITLSSVLLSFLFSLVIGIIFGIYPAFKASELTPISALRYE